MQHCALKVRSYYIRPTILCFISNKSIRLLVSIFPAFDFRRWVVKRVCKKYAIELIFNLILETNTRKLIFLTFPARFQIPIIFSYLNSSCSNLLDMRDFQEQVKKHSVTKIPFFD